VFQPVFEPSTSRLRIKSVYLSQRLLFTFLILGYCDYSCCMYVRIKMFCFLFLQVALEKYRSLAEWSGTSYLWFAFHWLAMSHSCYNPVIYCWMNTRFRAGFCTAFGRVPCLRRLVPLTARHRHCNTSSLTGMGLTGNAASANCRLYQ
jgi:hypothetical protein